MEGCNKRLQPLLSGQPVILAVNDPRLRRKKRIPNPALYITPFSTEEGSVDRLLFSFPGYGCEVVDVSTIKASELFRVGLNYRSAKLLTEAVKQVFTDKVINYEREQT